MLYSRSRLHKLLVDLGRPTEADQTNSIQAIGVDVKAHPTEGTQLFLTFLYPTLRSTNAANASARSPLIDTHDVSLSYTKILVPIKFEIDGDDVNVVITGEIQTKLCDSLPGLLATHSKLDGTSAGNLGSLVSQLVTAAYLKKMFPDMVNGLATTNDVYEMYRRGHSQPAPYTLTSCMAYGAGLEYTNMYNLNSPAVVRGAFIQKGGRILCRTLLWGAEDGPKFFDRLYCSRSITESEFRNALMMAGHRPVGAEGTKFAAILSVPSDGPAVPYMDTVQWGAMLSPNHILLATNAVAKDQKLLRTALKLPDSEDIALMAFTNTTGGPLSVRCALTTNAYPRAECIQRGFLWYAAAYKSWDFTAINLCGLPIEIPWRGPDGADRGQANIEKVVARITGSTPQVIGKNGSYDIVSLIPRSNSGGIVLGNKSNLSYFFHNGDGGRSMSIDARLELLGGFPGVVLDDTASSRSAFNVAGIDALPVKKNGEKVGITPSWTTGNAQPLLQNGSKYFVVAKSEFMSVGIKPQVGVLIAQ